MAGDTTGTWQTGNLGGLIVYWDLGCGSSLLSTANSWQGANYNGVTGSTRLISTLNATLDITGVQLERGSTASSFEYRSYGAELALCQRYYTVKTGYTVSMGGRYSTSLVFLSYQLPVQMRAIPTVTNATNWYVLNTTASEISSASTLNTVLSYIGGNVDIVINTSFNPAAYIYIVQSGAAAANVTFSAEL